MYKKYLIVCLLLLTIGIVGITFASFRDDKDLENQFKINSYDTYTTQTFVSPDNWLPGDTTENKVFITNNGNTSVAVRISFEEEWKSTTGEILDNVQNGDNVAIINFVNQDDWIKNGDYYYYKYKLQKDDKTSNFIDSVTFNENIVFESQCKNDNNVTSCIYGMGNYRGATYTLTLTIETMQYDNYATAWGISGVDIISK